jgi:hypothetical protein
MRLWSVYERRKMVNGIYRWIAPLHSHLLLLLRYSRLWNTGTVGR